jgi:hypothetical protein
MRVGWKLSQVVAMFATSPLSHLEEASQSKEEGRQALGHEAESQPSSNLVSIVGAANKVEEPSHRIGCRHWYLPLLCAWWPKVPECNMDAEIAILTHQKEGKASNHLGSSKTGRRIQWVVDKVGDKGSKAPVIAAVLEQVSERHCGMGETMDKEGLQQSLAIVQSPTDHSDMDGHVCSARGASIEQGWPGVEE